MVSLEAWKGSSISEDHQSLQRGLTNGLNDAIMSRGWAQFVTWLTRPNQLLMSVVEAGEGKSLMALRHLASSSMVLSDTLKSTLVAQI